VRFCACGSGMASVATTVSGSYTGSAIANLVIPRYVFAETAELIGSQGTAAIAATATTSYGISKNGTTARTLVFAVGATTATFTMGSATTYVAGDILALVARASPDATLGNLAWTFVRLH
jgi:hypothetical protein